MTPIEGSKKINENKIKNIYNFDNTKKLGKFKIGDRVRLSLEKNIFEKSYERYMISNTVMYLIII